MKYPAKSHRKHVQIPPLSESLAEFVGIMMGDGSMTPWQFMISLNASKDILYADFVRALIYTLFGIHTRTVRRRDGNCIVLVCSSRTLVLFLQSVGIVIGDKIRSITSLPQWILDQPNFERAFVRGLMDTDGCLYIHRHIVKNQYYKNIGLCFSNHSIPILIGFAEILQKYGIPGKVIPDRKLVYVYKQQGVSDYLHRFGTNNPRILTPYTIWRGD